MQNKKLNIRQMATKVIGLDRMETIFEEKEVFRNNMKILVDPKK